jgi:hypothetical protein
MNPKLKELIEKNELDWDNHHHREMYLRYWLNRPFREEKEEDR